MTPEQRLDRVERILTSMAVAGRKARSEFRQKIENLISVQNQNQEHWRTQSDELNEKINILIHAQIETSQQISELTNSQRQIDRTLLDFVDRHRKERNGDSST